jgi:hypothetical protein
MEERGVFGMERAEGPCADARTHAESSCSEAARLKAVAQEAAVALQATMRNLSQAALELEDAHSAVDGHQVTDAKVAAREAYRRQLEAAGTVMERQRAVTTWWREINRINGRSRRAYQTLERAHANSVDAQQGMGQAERLADSRRIRAEAAAQACIDARGRLAVCEEETGATVSAGALDALLAIDALGSEDGLDSNDGLGDDHAAPARVPVSAERTATTGTSRRSSPRMLVDILGRAAAGQEQPEPAAPQPVFEPLVAELFFQGDRAVLRWLARELSELTGHPPSHFLLLLQELVEAVQVAAADRRFLVFDAEDPLWGQFSQSECRTITGALSDLGFRYDPRDGWYGGRVPNANDLAVAIAYAGFDARRVRGLPTSSEGFRNLAGSISVAPLELIRESAPELTIRQLVEILGSRADALDDLWDDWGRLRPMLLTEATAVTHP